jgi:hypothetical protein
VRRGVTTLPGTIPPCSRLLTGVSSARGRGCYGAVATSPVPPPVRSTHSRGKRVGRGHVRRACGCRVHIPPDSQDNRRPCRDSASGRCARGNARPGLVGERMSGSPEAHLRGRSRRLTLTGPPTVNPRSPSSSEGGDGYHSLRSSLRVLLVRSGASKAARRSARPQRRVDR